MAFEKYVDQTDCDIAKDLSRKLGAFDKRKEKGDDVSCFSSDYSNSGFHIPWMQSSPPAASKQEQKNATSTPEAPKVAPDIAKPSFKITKVEVTKKSQKMGTGNTIAFSGDELKPTMGTPKKGYVFVIVSFSLEVPSEQLSYDPKKDFVLSDSTAVYSEFMKKDVWMQYNSGEYEKGKYESRRLYLMPSSRVRGAKIHFLGSDYPIESFLSEIPK